MSAQEAEARAEQVTAWQAQQEQLQEQLSASAHAVAAASHGVELAVSALEAGQQRSHRALAALLGNAYTWADAAFYGATALTVALLGAVDATAAARVPLLLVLGASLAVERALLSAGVDWDAVCHRGAFLLRATLEPTTCKTACPTP